MTYRPLPYDDAASFADMTGDCVQVGRSLSIPVQPRHDIESMATVFYADYVTQDHHTVAVSDDLAASGGTWEQHLG